MSADWTRMQVARDGTHHVVDGRPAYAPRFQRVLKFHAPGLAPARDESGAFHIIPDGREAYAQRYLDTFGFYEGRAAAREEGGWTHVLPDGRSLYVERYAWCGNFQEGRCTVRTREGRYLHITLDGSAAYGERYRYAGDFRDGAAVVQRDDGRSTHVDPEGRPLHGRWLLDLDAFHKGYARARDEDGWHHVDEFGRPAYGRRFAAVEPFYNGQARVERFDGALEVIDERGKTLLELRPALRSEFAALSGDLVGFWRTHAIGAAVQLGVFDALPATAEEVARRCDLQPERAPRLLRALAEIHLVERDGERWCATHRGAYLRSDHALTLADAAVEYGRHFTNAWNALPDALRLNGSWSPADIFARMAADAARVPGHHRMLRSYARHDYAEVPAALDLRGDEVVIDAGGGVGVLAELLLRRHPRLRVVLLDRPEAVRLVDPPPDLGGRLDARAVDIMSPWGVTGDAVVLARVLHDWDDGRAATILGHARAVLPEGGRVFIVEMVLSDEGAAGGLCDLHLLMSSGGRERTASEYGALLDHAGFELREIRTLPALPSVIIGVAR
jgi:hypothetical protein